MSQLLSELVLFSAQLFKYCISTLVDVPCLAASHISLVISTTGKPQQLQLCFKAIYPQDREGLAAPTRANTLYLKRQTSCLRLSKITLI